MSAELSELIEALAASPAKIQSLLNNASDERLHRRGAEGEFSCVESVCHLRDIEVEGYATRIKRILVEDEPRLLDIDGGRLAVERDYHKQDVREALRAFSLARKENLVLINGPGANQLHRAGTLEGLGLITLERLLAMMRDHDEGHISEIEQILRQQSGLAHTVT